MKKIFIAIIGAVVVGLLAAYPAAADVNDFKITNYDIQYNLGRNQDGRSTLQTKETITAVFPQANQNHGIERYIPSKYDGHRVGLKVQSVKNENQKKVKFTTYQSGKYTVVRVGDADKYVHGQQTYVIEYSQQDVTKAFSDTKADEFYWDTNGTEWQVPIDNLSVSLTVDENLAESLSGKSRCYSGRYGLNSLCQLSQDQPGVFTASMAGFSKGENMTLAVGFEPGTFAEYETPLIEKIVAVWGRVQVYLLAVSSILLAYIAVRYSNRSSRRKDLGTIVPEYLPPKDSSISLSGTLLAGSSSFAAQLIDLAVRHYIKIYETKPAKFLSPAVYEMEIVKPATDLREEEREFIFDVFKNDYVGTKISTKDLKKDYKLSSRLMDNPAKIKKLKRTTYGIKEKSHEESDWFRRFGIGTLVIGLLLLSPPLLILSAVAFILSKTLWVYTDKGLDLYRHLRGLKMYISVAEEQRLKMLQSPKGAEKVQADTNDPKMLVKLYEKTLPYAVLFGQANEWNKQLGKYYEAAGQQPDWYTGASLAAFNAASFSSAMTSLTTSINSTGASYSSSGGSSGGGFSGGGGGGGGGGGW